MQVERQRGSSAAEFLRNTDSSSSRLPLARSRLSTLFLVSFGEKGISGCRSGPLAGQARESRSGLKFHTQTEWSKPNAIKGSIGNFIRSVVRKIATVFSCFSETCLLLLRLLAISAKILRARNKGFVRDTASPS